MVRASVVAVTLFALFALLWLAGFATVCLVMAASEALLGPAGWGFLMFGRCFPVADIWPALVFMTAPVALAAWLELVFVDHRLGPRRWPVRLAALALVVPVAMWLWSAVYGYQDDLRRGVAVDFERFHRTWGFWWSCVQGNLIPFLLFRPHLVLGCFVPYLWLMARLAPVAERARAAARPVSV